MKKEMLWNIWKRENRYRKNIETGNYYIVGESHAENKKIIRFDIAVTQSLEGSKSGQGGIQVLGVNLGGKKESKEGQQNVSRIQLSIFLSNINSMKEIEEYVKNGENRFSVATKNKKT